MTTPAEETAIRSFIDKFDKIEWTGVKIGDKISMVSVMPLGDDFEVFTKNKNRKWLKEVFTVCENFTIIPLPEEKSVRISFYMKE